MKTLTKRLLALEGGQGSTYDHLSDAEIIDRMNELTVQLRPFGLDFPLLDGGPDDADRLRATEVLLAKTMTAMDTRHRLTH